jgi:hypothetical protein
MKTLRRFGTFARLQLDDPRSLQYDFGDFCFKSVIFHLLMKKTTLLLITVVTISFLQMDCKDDEPIIPPNNYIPTDTTSQNFTISTWEFGKPFATSYANDAWVFDKNNIWVVGLFQGIDSTNPQGFIDGNIMRWDGVSWKSFANNIIHLSSGVNSISALDTSIIYFGAVGLLKYKNGDFDYADLSHLQFSSGQSINYVWASSENNVWGVGGNGMVVYYNGTVWKNLSIATNYQLIGVTGSKKTGIGYAVGYNSLVREYIIAKLDHGNTGILFTTTLASVSFKDVDMLSEDTLLICGSALFVYSLSINTFNDAYYGQSNINRFPYYYDRLAIVSRNEQFIFGHHDYTDITKKVYLTHYNGKRYTDELLISRDISSYNGASARDGIGVFTMRSQQKAVIVTIRRN